jgi:putative SOS response-associated peptidase YedK
MKELGTMTNWRLYEKGTTDFALPTDSPLHLVGNVTNHPKFEDATCVRSVTVKEVDLVDNKVTTGRGIYQLETIDDEYSEWLEEQNFTFPTAETLATEPKDTTTIEPVSENGNQVSSESATLGKVVEQ